MPKRSLPRRGHKKNKNKLRPNPVYGASVSIETATSVAGNLLVNDALRGATLEERVIISSLVPIVLSVLRSIPKTSIDSATEKILNPDQKENTDA